VSWGAQRHLRLDQRRDHGTCRVQYRCSRIGVDDDGGDENGDDGGGDQDQDNAHTNRARRVLVLGLAHGRIR
jgi:hypothetical protein